MPALRGKIQLYANARAQGLEPKLAGAHAGYTQNGLAVTVCRLEKRADVKAEIKRLRKGGTSVADTPETDNEFDKWAMKDSYASPLELMRDVMNNPKAPRALRYQAAKDALPYCHARKEGGKKEEAANEAKKAAAGKFQTQGRPRLRAVN